MKPSANLKLLKRALVLSSLALLSSCSQQLNNVGLNTGLGNAGSIGANIYNGGLNLGLNLGQMRIGTSLPGADISQAQTSIGSNNVSVNTGPGTGIAGSSTAQALPASPL